MSLRAFWTTATVAAVTAASPAFANDWWPNGLFSTGVRPGSFFVDVTGTVGIQPLPKIETYGRYFPAAVGAPRVGQPSADFNTVVGGAGGEFGYVLPQGSLPAWLGANARFAISGNYWTGRSSSNAEVIGSFAYQFSSLNGAFVATVGAIGDRSSFNLRRSGYRLGLRFATDYAVGQNWTLTPMIGAFGGTGDDHYGIRFAPFAGNLEVPAEILAKIATTRIGGSLGLGARYRATPWLSFGLIGNVDLAHVRASLSASDCVAAAVVPSGQPCAASTIRSFSSLSATASRFGVRLGGQASASFDFDWFVLTAAGHVQWDSKVPVFVGPTRQTLVPGAAGTPAGIRFGSEVGYGASLTARFPLPF